MLVIGLTGGIGSGKTTAANLFEKKNITVIDADKIARELVFIDTPAYQQICAHFGSNVLTESKRIDRKKLGKRIFQNEADRKWLESLLHPLIRNEMEIALKASSSQYAILVIALLLETEKNPLVDRILVIDAPIELQQKRTQSRDNRLLDEINAIISTQIDRQARLDEAHDIIQNDGTLEHLQTQVDKLHEEYVKRAESENHLPS